MHNGEALTDEDRKPWLRALNRAIRSWIADKRDVVLACSALREWHRNALREGVPVPESIRFAYLKGTYEEINRRLSLRVGHFMPESLLSSQFATLEEPDSFEALAVDVNQPVAIIVDSIVTRLQLGSSTRLAQG
jgi:gluconokinase